MVVLPAPGILSTTIRRLIARSASGCRGPAAVGAQPVQRLGEDGVAAGVEAALHHVGEVRERTGRTRARGCTCCAPSADETEQCPSVLRGTPKNATLACSGPDPVGARSGRVLARSSEPFAVTSAPNARLTAVLWTPFAPRRLSTSASNWAAMPAGNAPSSRNSSHTARRALGHRCGCPRPSPLRLAAPAGRCPGPKARTAGPEQHLGWRGVDGVLRGLLARVRVELWGCGSRPMRVRVRLWPER